MLKTKEEIKEWLDEMKIQNYSINDDLTVDVNGDVNLANKGLTEIPIQFGMVDGNFDCSNNKLTSLKGGPEIVGLSYYINKNNLESYSHLPSKVLLFFYHDGIEEQGIDKSFTLEEVQQRNDIIKAKKALEEVLKAKDLNKEQAKKPRMKI